MPISVDLLDPTVGQDEQYVEALVGLVNAVYAVAEDGLWEDGRCRTDTDEVQLLIEAGEIVVARSADGTLAGIVRVHDVGRDAAEFGMLATAPAFRGTGVGRALIEFVEQRSREQGREAMQLELLVPRDWSHPTKEFLHGWYGRRGYRLLRTTTLDESYPHLTPSLVTPCLLEIHRKALR
jgi:GNAT superfamily N-acetyltransferase